MKTALITGITGQDGAYLSRLLLEKGYRVLGLVRKGEPRPYRNLVYLGVYDRIDFIEIDLTRAEDISRLLESTQPDEIYNLAAQSSVARSFEEPDATIRFNVTSTLNLLEAIRTQELPAKFYQASSSEMFGKVNALPVTEETVLHPVSPYAISKASCHWLAVNYREAYGLFCCCGILFNHESVLRPEYFVTKKVISTAVRISKGTREKLTVGNLDIERDWGYAPEYVKSMWRMLQQAVADEYVIASNEMHSLKDFVKTTFALLGLNWREHTHSNKRLLRPSDIDRIYGNPEKAKKKLDWDYAITFEELIRRLVDEEIRLQEE